ncbi:MAG: aspartate/glutamate racemase family protein [Nocardioidaceae bacterium]
MPDGPGRRSRLVGILGGMGPRATVDFYDKLVSLTPATTDQDHVRVVIWADPTVPSRQEALLSQGTDPTPWLEEGVRHLIAAGAELLVVPCNTVHAFLGPVMAAHSVEFLSIIDTTIEAVRERGAHRVGLLATDGALASGLFQAGLDGAGIDCMLPDADGQRLVRELVEAVKAGDVPPSLHQGLVGLLTQMHRQGATAIIAGCTEISSVVGGLPEVLAAQVVDPSRELAVATIRRTVQAAAVGQGTGVGSTSAASDGTMK